MPRRARSLVVVAHRAGNAAPSALTALLVVADLALMR
jgi:hypothetical protein